MLQSIVNVYHDRHSHRYRYRQFYRPSFKFLLSVSLTVLSWWTSMKVHVDCRSHPLPMKADARVLTFIVKEPLDKYLTQLQLWPRDASVQMTHTKLRISRGTVRRAEAKQSSKSLLVSRGMETTGDNILIYFLSCAIKRGLAHNEFYE